MEGAHAPPPNPGPVTISAEYRRHTGGKDIHGAVTITFDTSVRHGFRSMVRWPAGNNYDEVVRGAVDDLLIELQGSLEWTEVTLEAIIWNDVHSCERGFAQAAREATRLALSGRSEPEADA